MEAIIEVVPFHMGLAYGNHSFWMVCLRRKFAAFCRPLLCGTPSVELEWELDSVAKLQLSLTWKLVAV